jgi:hypothetical protein
LEGVPVLSAEQGWNIGRKARQRLGLREIGSGRRNQPSRNHFRWRIDPAPKWVPHHLGDFLPRGLCIKRRMEGRSAAPEGACAGGLRCRVRARRGRRGLPRSSLAAAAWCCPAAGRCLARRPARRSATPGAASAAMKQCRAWARGASAVAGRGEGCRPHHCRDRPREHRPQLYVLDGGMGTGGWGVARARCPPQRPAPPCQALPGRGCDDAKSCPVVP